MERIVKIGKHTFSSLKIRNYRLYFFGQAISLSGTWMQTIAQSWLVLQLTGSGTALGIITALQFIPVLVLGTWGGVIVDRFSKRRLLFFTNAFAGICALALGIVVIADVVKLWMVYVFALLFGLVNVVDNPARQTFALEMVDREQLNNVISLNSMLMNGTRAVGPAISAIIIAWIGLGWCFLINAISYSSLLIALLLMRGGELHKSDLVPRARGQLREGLRYVWHTPVLKHTLLVMAVIGTFVYEFSVSLPLLAQFTFHGDAASYAALTTAFGIGSVIGGFFAAHRRRTSAYMLVPASICFGSAILLVSVAPTFWLAVFFLLLVGFCSINFSSIGNVTLQLQSAPNMRGRVMSLWTMAFLGTTPIGGPIIGWIGEYIGPRWGLAVGGLAAIAAAMYGAMKFEKDEASMSLRPWSSAKADKGHRDKTKIL